MKTLVRSFVGRAPLMLQMQMAKVILWLEDVLQVFRCSYLRRSGMTEFLLDAHSPHGDVCHILASGWSLNDSFPRIDRSNAFVIGFNFSFLKCPDPDVHFIENASSADKRFFINTFHHYAALNIFKISDKTRLVFKNISEFKNSTKLICWLYGREAEFVRDRHYRIFSGKGVGPTLALMLEDKRGLPQAVSSVVGLVIWAKNMGFKNIVVHGLDFYGPHFYGPDLHKAIFEGYIPACFDPAIGSHKTVVGENGVGVKDLFIELKKSLERHGVKLSAGSALSPSAVFLGSTYD